MIIQQGSGKMSPVGLNEVLLDRFIAWPVDSNEAEICLYYYDEKRWSRHSDDTIHVSAWMNIPEKPMLEEQP